MPEGVAGTVMAKAWCPSERVGHFQNCFVPRGRSGILEREAGGLRSGMFFHMVKMISCCVCE